MATEKMILSTGNTMVQTGGPNASDKSHTELTWSLRDNFEAAKQEAEETEAEAEAEAETEAEAEEEKPTQTGDQSHQSWLFYSPDEKTTYIPRLDFSNSALQEEREQYDITAKIFFLSDQDTSAREEHVREAIDLVKQELHMPNVDLLVVSFPGVYFDEESECCPDKIKSRGPKESSPEPVDSQLESWKIVEKLHSEGLVRRLGVSEFGANRLGPFLDKAHVRPCVNQISLRDCCSVPKPLSSLAKDNGVDLLVNNDSVNIMPRGTIRHLLDHGGAGVLSKKRRRGVPFSGDVIPQWVIKYTAVVKNRGVVENKGYFACAKYVEGETENGNHD